MLFRDILGVMLLFAACYIGMIEAIAFAAQYYPRGFFQ